MIRNGNKYALEVYEAMAYQISKEIGSSAESAYRFFVGADPSLA